ncbi:MAG: S8 family serine peptidase [Myxococcota bacterium]
MRPLVSLLLASLALASTSSLAESTDPHASPAAAGWRATWDAKASRSPVHPDLLRWAEGEDMDMAAAPWIEAISTGDPAALAEELATLGVVGLQVAGNRVSGQLTRDAVAGLEHCVHLAAARPTRAFSNRSFFRRKDPWRHPRRERPRRTGSGSVTSEGLAAMGVDRLPASTIGRGVSVGLLADSFDCVGGGRDTDIETGDLPAETTVLADLATAGCIDEGRALAQVVHDVAPGARLGFHTAFRGQADFANGIEALASEFVADVIVDDVVYADEPFFQDGVIARAVDTVNDWGVRYVSAAGNSGRRSYEGPFRDSGQTGFFEPIGPTRRHDFDPGPDVDVFLQITVAANSEAIVILQWNEPFASASTADPAQGALSDYDLLIYDTEDPVVFERFQPDDVVARSTAFNVGGDAVEAALVRNPTDAPLVLFLGIERFLGPGFDGPDVDLVKLVVQGALTIDEHDTQSGTSYGHANAAGALAIGAAAYFETPAFGVSPPLLEPFSSAGGVALRRDSEGNALPEPLVRETPDLVGPDGVNNTVLFGDSEVDDDDFPNFFGTSAAAPHVAGVAALLQGAVRGGAALRKRDGTLFGAWLCEPVGHPYGWRRSRTVLRAPDAIPDALAAGARLGPCWSLSPRALERRLERTAIDMADPGYDFDSGHGLVSADRAFRTRRGRRLGRSRRW